MSKKGETAVSIASELDYSFSRSTYFKSVFLISVGTFNWSFLPQRNLWFAFETLIQSWCKLKGNTVFFQLMILKRSLYSLSLSSEQVTPSSRKDPLQSWIFQWIDFDSWWVSVKGSVTFLLFQSPTLFTMDCCNKTCYFI